MHFHREKASKSGFLALDFRNGYLYDQLVKKQVSLLIKGLLVCDKKKFTKRWQS